MLDIDVEKLPKLLDQSVIYQGMSCRVIEILSDEWALVLLDGQDRKVIQANQYGDAGRLAPKTFTVSLLDAEGQGFNPELAALATFDLLR